MKVFRHIAEGKATTMGHIKRQHLTEALCVIPDIATLNKADGLYRNQLNKIINNNNQIQTLTKLRDTLLPKLMSGEVRVKN